MCRQTNTSHNANNFRNSVYSMMLLTYSKCVFMNLPVMNLVLILHYQLQICLYIVCKVVRKFRLMTLTLVLCKYTQCHCLLQNRSINQEDRKSIALD